MEKNTPTPSQVGILLPDKPECTTHCLGDVNDLHFLCVFLDFHPRSPTLQTEPRVMELVVESASVEHPH